jgi:glycosyltransferase involved in cell wall biosynthesis
MRGKLDHRTILRYAYIYRDPRAGGIEQYLHHVNRRLLERNALMILQMYLAEDRDPPAIITEPIGRGQLVWVPVTVQKLGSSVAKLPQRLARASAVFRRSLTSARNGAGPGWRQRIGRGVCNGWPYLHYSFFVNNDRVMETLEQQAVDLAVFHWLTYDANEVLYRTADRCIPFVFINHFDNARYRLKSVHRQIAGAAGLAGVSDRNVPAGIRDGYVNLSDGIDSEFFSPKLAQPVATAANQLRVLLSARIAPGKGHLDAVRALGMWVQHGLDVELAFAGGSQSDSFAAELQQFVVKTGLSDRVKFLGKLGLAELRDWYAASDVVVLPSYSEGLGRALLEAQAMQRPVVAYATGGVADAVVADTTGFLVEVGDYLALAMQVEQLLRDGNQRKALGEAGRIFVDTHFGLAKLVEKHEAFYLAAIEKHDPPGRRDNSANTSQTVVCER